MERRCPSAFPCSGRPDGPQLRTTGPGWQRHVALLVALALAASLSACTEAPATEPEDAAEVTPTIAADVGTVARAAIGEDLVIRGTITARPNDDVRISALVAGRVDAVTVAEGDSVRQGQVVARIDTRGIVDQQRQAQAAKQQALSQLENARLNQVRNEQLFARGIAAGKEVEDARTALAQAQAAVEQADAALNTVGLQLERASVRSPIAGQVVKRMVSVGEQVDGTAAQPILQIANLDVVELAAAVPAAQLAQVAVDQVVRVIAEGHAAGARDGRVVAIAPAIDPATNTALVRIRLDNHDHALQAGLFAEAHVRLAEHAAALVVPTTALVRDDSGAAVYVVNGTTATRTTVTTGLEQEGRTEVLTGVTEGQRILVSGVHGLGPAVTLAGAP